MNIITKAVAVIVGALLLGSGITSASAKTVIPCAGGVRNHEACARQINEVPSTIRWTTHYENVGYGYMCFEAHNGTGKSVVTSQPIYLQGGHVRHYVPKDWWVIYCTDGVFAGVKDSQLRGRIAFRHIGR